MEWNNTGFLLVGPPGAGKSELALQLIEQGATLIADDQVLLNGATATCPAPTRGKLHLRDRGFFDLPYKNQTDIAVIFQSPLPAFPISQPPALDVPVITADFQSANILTFIKNALSRV